MCLISAHKMYSTDDCSTLIISLVTADMIRQCEDPEQTKVYERESQ